MNVGRGAENAEPKVAPRESTEVSEGKGGADVMKPLLTFAALH